MEQQEALMLAKIKEILLQEDRKELEMLKETLNTPEQLEQKMQPILKNQVAYLRENFPKEFGAIVDVAIEQKLEQSKDQLLDVIYPVLGQMIKKYINHQFQLLKDRIDMQLKTAFSSKGLFRMAKGRLMGMDQSDLILKEVDKPQIHQIFVVAQYSGLLIGEYSATVMIDQDMIVGMLTAIKAFAKDVLSESEDLEFINYEKYKILIQNFHQSYIAVILSGSFAATEKEKITDSIDLFYQKNMKGVDLSIVDTKVTNQINDRLTQHFASFNFDDD